MKVVRRIGVLFFTLFAFLIIGAIGLFQISPRNVWVSLVAYGNVQIVGFFVPQILNPTICFPGNNTILHLLPRNANPSVVEFIIRQIGTVNMKNDLGETPLHSKLKWRASAYKADVSVEIVRLLIKYGADLKSLDNAGYVPLYYALTLSKDEGGKEIVHEILKSESNLYSRDRILQVEALKRVIDYYPELLPMVFTKGISPNLQLDNGQSLLHMALYSKSKNHNPALHAMISAGAQINVKNASGETALDVSEKLGLEEDKQFLLKLGAKSGIESIPASTAGPAH